MWINKQQLQSTTLLQFQEQVIWAEQTFSVPTDGFSYSHINQHSQEHSQSQAEHLELSSPSKSMPLCLKLELNLYALPKESNHLWIEKSIQILNSSSSNIPKWKRHVNIQWWLSKYLQISSSTALQLSQLCLLRTATSKFTPTCDTSHVFTKCCSFPLQRLSKAHFLNQQDFFIHMH